MSRTKGKTTASPTTSTTSNDNYYSALSETIEVTQNKVAELASNYENFEFNVTQIHSKVDKFNDVIAAVTLMVKKTNDQQKQLHETLVQVMTLMADEEQKRTQSENNILGRISSLSALVGTTMDDAASTLAHTNNLQSQIYELTTIVNNKFQSVDNKNIIFSEQLTALNNKLETERIAINQHVTTGISNLAPKIEEVLNIGIPTTIRKFEEAHKSLNLEIISVRNSSASMATDVSKITQLISNLSTQFSNNNANLNSMNNQSSTNFEKPLPESKANIFYSNNIGIKEETTFNHLNNFTPAENIPNHYAQSESGSSEKIIDHHAFSLHEASGINKLLKLIPKTTTPTNDAERFAALMTTQNENQQYRSMKDTMFEKYSGNGTELLTTIRKWTTAIATHSRNLNVTRYMNDAPCLISTRLTGDAADWWNDIALDNTGINYIEFVELLYERFHIATIDKTRRNNFKLLKWSFKEFPSNSTASSLHMWYSERNQMYGSIEKAEQVVPESEMCWFVWEALHPDVQIALKPNGWYETDEDDCPFTKVEDFRKQLTKLFQKPHFQNKDKFTQAWTQCKGDIKSAHSHLFKHDSMKDGIENDKKDSEKKNGATIHPHEKNGKNKNNNEDKKSTDGPPKADSNNKNNSNKPHEHKDSPKDDDDFTRNEKAVRHVISQIKNGTLHKTTWFPCVNREKSGHTGGDAHSFAFCNLNPRQKENSATIQRIFGDSWDQAFKTEMKRLDGQWIAVIQSDNASSNSQTADNKSGFPKAS